MSKLSGLNVTRKLGRGMYGKVVEIEYEGRLCALKYGPSESISDEAKVIEAIGKHPNIVNVIKSGVDKDEYSVTHWMIMERFDESLVSSFEHERIKLEHIKTVYRHVLEALIHIQKKGFVHKDCHLGNIGVKWDTPTRPRFILCDFGMAESYREDDGTIRDIPCVTSDARRFFSQMLWHLPYPDSIPQASEEKISNLVRQATAPYRPRVLLYLLELASEEAVRKAIWTAVEVDRRDSLRLILAFKARQTGQTLASVCRELLEHKKIQAGPRPYCCLDPFMTLIEWAGYADNPEIKRIVSPENSRLIHQQVQGPLPELLQRVLSM